VYKRQELLEVFAKPDLGSPAVLWEVLLIFELSEVLHVVLLEELKGMSIVLRVIDSELPNEFLCKMPSSTEDQIELLPLRLPSEIMTEEEKALTAFEVLDFGAVKDVSRGVDLREIVRKIDVSWFLCDHLCVLLFLNSQIMNRAVPRYYRAV